MATKKIGFAGKNIYVGIDVHKKTYAIAAIVEGTLVKKATVAARPEELSLLLNKWFLGAKIMSVYEAGFSGFGLHRTLSEAGITNIVVNAASIEVASNDKKKTDARDSKKMAEQLFSGRLRGIYIPTIDEELRRQITRAREQIVEDRSRVAQQIKSKLHYFGLTDIEDKRVMSRSYLLEIEEMNLPETLKICFKILAQRWRFLDQQLAEINIEMQGQSFEDAESEELYRSVPGIGPVGARVLSNELGDLAKRFKNQKSLYQFTGLTPCEHSSGESIRRGHIDRQGSPRIRKILVEAAWKAIEMDGALKICFNRIAFTRGKKRAIVAIARKLIGRMRACFAQRVHYAIGLCE